MVEKAITHRKLDIILSETKNLSKEELETWMQQHPSDSKFALEVVEALCNLISRGFLRWRAQRSNDYP